LENLRQDSRVGDVPHDDRQDSLAVRRRGFRFPPADGRVRQVRADESEDDVGFLDQRDQLVPEVRALFEHPVARHRQLLGFQRRSQASAGRGVFARV
jgi:hypothetical protein